MYSSSLKINTNITPIYAKSIEEFNSYVDKYKATHVLKLTKSNNIAQSNLRNMPCCITCKRANHMEFFYLDSRERIRVIYAIHYDETSKSGKSESIAYDALNYFKGIMEVIPKDDIEEDIELFTCPENKNSRYYNYCNERFTNNELNNCFSLDRNSAFLASMLEVYPQTKPWVDKFQEDKIKIKAKPKESRTQAENELLQYDKIIIGWMNNPKYHRSHAWKKIIDNSNRKIHELRKKIESAGHIVLVVNTDAVKFIGKYDYQESKDLGDFKYEWFNTKMYIKSVKSYAYLDGDKWKFKQAGECKFDREKPREQWTLDDYKNMDTLNTARIIIKENKLEVIYDEK